jgi:hypothetical protein
MHIAANFRSHILTELPETIEVFTFGSAASGVCFWEKEK